MLNTRGRCAQVSSPEKLGRVGIFINLFLRINPYPLFLSLSGGGGWAPTSQLQERFHSDFVSITASNAVFHAYTYRHTNTAQNGKFFQIVATQYLDFPYLSILYPNFINSSVTPAFLSVSLVSLGSSPQISTGCHPACVATLKYNP